APQRQALVRSIRGGMSHSGTCQPPGSQESPAGRSRHRTPDTEQGRSSRLVHRVGSLLFARPRVAKATGLTGLAILEGRDQPQFTVGLYFRQVFDYQVGGEPRRDVVHPTDRESVEWNAIHFAAPRAQNADPHLEPRLTEIPGAPPVLRGPLP